MQTRELLLGAGALLFAAFSMSGQAGEIARWVDEEGVTHFGNPQFAPGDADQVTLVDVQPANGMAVPDTVASAGGQPRFMVIKKKGKSNPRGWQGYTRNKSGGGRGYYRKR